MARLHNFIMALFCCSWELPKHKFVSFAFSDSLLQLFCAHCKDQFDSSNMIIARTNIIVPIWKLQGPIWQFQYNSCIKKFQARYSKCFAVGHFKDFVSDSPNQFQDQLNTDWGPLLALRLFRKQEAFLSFSLYIGVNLTSISFFGWDGWMATGPPWIKPEICGNEYNLAKLEI